MSCKIQTAGTTKDFNIFYWTVLQIVVAERCEDLNVIDI